jgi:AraC-like DNA-binding protein
VRTVSTVRVAPLVPLPAVLRELGFDPVAVLGAVGCAPADFDDPDRTESYVKLSQVLAHCVATTGCGHLGLLLGMRGGPHTLGVAGHLLLHASDVGTALADLARVLDVHDRGGVASLHTEGDECALEYAVIEPGVEAPEQLLDLAIAVALNIMRALCGRGWTPDAVELPRRHPVDAEPWRRVFRAPLQFDAPRCALRFHRRWLARPLPTADRSLHDTLQRYAATLGDPGGAGVVWEVRRALRAGIANGGGHAEQVAQRLGVHPRTLNRRLAAAGTTFQQVRDETLHAMALQLLGTTSMPVAAAAAALGYADATAFIRAFRRWSGRTPARWRREVGRRGSDTAGASSPKTQKL